MTIWGGNMSDAAELLQQLGFGEYEARAYIALLQHNPLNGYELAKASGIPRANIYGVLQRLEERQAVIRVEAEGSVRYLPVSPDQIIPQMGHHFQTILEDTQRALNELAVPVETDLSHNILGYDSLLDQARYQINAAQEELFLALWYPEAQVLAEDIARAAQRNIRLTTLCLQACPSECGGCHGDIYRYRLLPEQSIRWLIVAQDKSDMVIGEIGPARTLALRTRQSSIIQMAVQYIQSSIAWATVLTGSDTTFDKNLSPEAQHILRKLGTKNNEAGWLAYMRGLLNAG
jgi:HTH-type transcriptional regulator, sugar sensing transcriptional regulator